MGHYDCPLITMMMTTWRLLYYDNVVVVLSVLFILLKIVWQLILTPARIECCLPIAECVSRYQWGAFATAGQITWRQMPNCFV